MITSVAANYYGFNFFPGSRAQGFICDAGTDYVLNFTYVQNTFTRGQNFVYLGVAGSFNAYNNPYTNMLILGVSTMKLYRVCTSGACLGGGCDLNGNCINGCASSSPARTGSNCTCPSYYIDDAVNAQC